MSDTESVFGKQGKGSTTLIPIQLKLGWTIKTIAIYKHMSVTEIKLLIHQQFSLPLSTKIVGLIKYHENENISTNTAMMIPISFLSQNPKYFKVCFLHVYTIFSVKQLTMI